MHFGFMDTGSSVHFGATLFTFDKFQMEHPVFGNWDVRIQTMKDPTCTNCCWFKYPRSNVS